MKSRERLVLRGGRVPGREGLQSLTLEGGQVVAVAEAGSAREADGAPAVDLQGRLVLPAFVNAHDVLDASTMPPLGRPPYANLYEWVEAAARAAGDDLQAMRVAPADRLFLGGLRNLLAGVASVVHHEADHRSLAREDFPVRVQRRYGFAHSPGLGERLRRTYRTTDRRIPWFVRAGAGVDERARGEIALLAQANVLRQNTVIVHGTALGEHDAPRLAEAGAAVVWCPEVDERLFGAQPPLAALRSAGVPVGLGSGSAGEGGRDFLSALLAGRNTRLVDDDTLLALATEGGSAVARLPRGGTGEGTVADLLVAPSHAGLLDGSRAAVELVIVGGRPLYGAPDLLLPLVPGSERFSVDGAARALVAPLHRRLRGLRAAAGSRARWLEGVVL